MYEIDVSILMDNNSTIKEHLFCSLIQKNELHLLLKYIKVDPVDKDWIESLIKKGWLKGMPEQVTSLLVTDKFKNLSNKVIKEDMFDELLRHFPSKVVRPGGNTDYLRTDQKNCRIRYSRITKNSYLKHDMILQALIKEVELRTKNNTLKYFKSLPNWLKTEEWQTYFQLLADEQVAGNEKKTYGTDLL